MPVPYEHRGVVLRDVVFARPKAGVVAETRRVADTGQSFQALLGFLVAGVAELGGDGEPIADKAAIREAVLDMPFPTINWASIQVLLGIGAKDEIDTYSQCPRCKTVLQREGPDLIRNLEVRYADEPVTATRTLEYPVVITSGGQPVVEVTSVRARCPTLRDCIAAAGRVGYANETRLQFAILAEAVTEVSGEVKDEKWRRTWGATVFERMDTADSRALGEALQGWGYPESLERICPKCNRNWEEAIDTSGFFVSGLRGESAGPAGVRSG
jgi:hypothetical protein